MIKLFSELAAYVYKETTSSCGHRWAYAPSLVDIDYTTIYAFDATSGYLLLRVMCHRRIFEASEPSANIYTHCAAAMRLWLARLNNSAVGVKASLCFTKRHGHRVTVISLAFSHDVVMEVAIPECEIPEGALFTA